MLKAVDDFKDVTSVAEARVELGIGAADVNDEKIISRFLGFRRSFTLTLHDNRFQDWTRERTVVIPA
jgi:hypothetical protein